jgi:hypothetical protein
MAPRWQKLEIYGDLMGFGAGFTVIPGRELRERTRNDGLIGNERFDFTIYF